MRSRIGSFGATAFFVITLAPLFLFVDYDSVADGRFRTQTLLIRGGGIVLLALAIALSVRRSGPVFLKRLGTKTHAPILLFILYVSVSSLFSINPFTSLLYSATLLILFVFYIQLADLDKLNLYHIGRSAAVLYIAIMVLLVFSLGLDGRRVGGIQANNFAKIAFSAFCVSFLWRGWAGLILKIVALGFILLVNSRGALVAATVFYAMMWLTANWNSRGIALAAFAASSVLLVAMLYPPAAEFLFVDVLAISDPTRGLGSGFSGRTEYWELGLSVLAENPLFGYGFQTRTSTDAIDLLTISAHQGFINLMLDIGVVGLLLFAAAVLVAVIGGLRYISSAEKSADPRLALECRFALAFIVSFLLIWMIEPVYINFGQPPSVLLIFCLAHGAELLRVQMARRQIERPRRIPSMASRPHLGGNA